MFKYYNIPNKWCILASWSTLNWWSKIAGQSFMRKTYCCSFHKVQQNNNGRTTNYVLFLSSCHFVALLIWRQRRSVYYSYAWYRFLYGLEHKALTSHRSGIDKCFWDLSTFRITVCITWYKLVQMIDDYL